MVASRDRRLSLPDLVIASAGLAIFLLSTMLKSSGPLLLLLVVYTVLVAARALAGRRFALIGSGLFVLGLSVHLYMLIRAGQHPAINQSQPDNFSTLMSVLRREQYPPIDPFRRQAPLWSWQFPYYYDFLLRQFSFLGDGRGALARIGIFIGPIFLGLLGIFHGLRRARPWIWMLLVGYLINADGLTLYLNFSNHEVRERDYFYSTGFMFAAMLIGLGAAALLRYAAGPEGKSAQQLSAGKRVAAVRAGLLAKIAAGLLIVIAALPLLVPGHPKWVQHDRSRNSIPREYAWNMLAGLDRNAILFTNGDNDTFPIWYLQEVEKYRRDVTVLNLSLVNLPWYVKQMRQRDPDLPLSYTDQQIDQLEARIYENPSTGEQQIVYVRDYIVHDVLTANRKRPAPRPAFFAVTIPQENMDLYFPYLKMEGLAFRLMPDKQPGGEPGVDGERTLQNLLGVYDYRALLTGDSAARRRQFAAMVGAAPAAREAGAPVRLAGVAEARVDLEPLVGLLGDKRRDVWRDQNTTNLLGNYPAAAVRAGYDYLLAGAGGIGRRHRAVRPSHRPLPVRLRTGAALRPVLPHGRRFLSAAAGGEGAQRGGSGVPRRVSGGGRTGPPGAAGGGRGVAQQDADGDGRQRTRRRRPSPSSSADRGRAARSDRLPRAVQRAAGEAATSRPRGGSSSAGGPPAGRGMPKWSGSCNGSTPPGPRRRPRTHQGRRDDRRGTSGADRIPAGRRAARGGAGAARGRDRLRRFHRQPPHGGAAAPRVRGRRRRCADRLLRSGAQAGEPGRRPGPSRLPLRGGGPARARRGRTAGRRQRPASTWRPRPACARAGGATSRNIWTATSWRPSTCWRRASIRRCATA